MLLTLFAFAVAFVAILRATALAAEARRLREERDGFLATIDRLRKQLEALTGNPPPLEAPIEPAAPPIALAVEVRSAAASPTPIVASEPVAFVPAVEVAVPRVEESAEPTPTSTDWESFIGVQGALWMGGVAFLLSGIFFARWAVEQEMLSPTAGFGLLLLAGAAALAGAEGAWRMGFARAASPVSAAGIAILSIACLAANGRYALLSTPMAFAAMVVVTATGGGLSVRYRAYATALLSLFTGFALSVALAVGDIEATLVFAYVLLIEGAALAVAVKHRWFSLPWLAILGTLFLQARWCWKFLAPETFAVGILIVLVSALFHLFAPSAAPREDRPRLTGLGAIGTLGAFLFAIAFAAFPRFVPQWPLLFGLVGLLDLAILFDAVTGKRAIRLRTAAFVTAFFLGWWSIQGLKEGSGASIVAATLSAIAMVALFGLARRFALAGGRADARELRVLEIAALAAGGGLVLFGTVMVAWGRGSPVGPFLAIATALALILVEVSADVSRLKGTLFLGTLGLAGLTQIWFLTSVDTNTLVLYLAGPVVVSLLLSFLSQRKAGSGVDLEAEIAVQTAGWIAIGGLFMALRASEGSSSGWPLFLPLASTGWPLFLALGIQIVVVMTSVLRTNWTFELPVLLASSALYLQLWQRAYLTPAQTAVAFGAGLLLYLAFLVFPWIAARSGGAGLSPWVASALSGPLFFFPLRAIVASAVGDTGPGLLPLAMAALCALGVRSVERRSDASPADAAAARWEGATPGLYAGVAFWLASIAIGLQFDRQWATLAWAILATLLAALYVRFPQPVVPFFSGALYALAAVRLLLNPAVLDYGARGLPLFNWILYTYGGVALCAWFGQKWLRRASSNRLVVGLSTGVALSGLLILFWLINLEILDFFSTGARIALSEQSGYAAKLAFSVGWGAYAIVLLAAGVARRLKTLRYLSLAFMILTVAKVFLYDLAALGGFFRVFSFFGLAAGLILVSFFYQRFVFKRGV